ncbi:MAG TPA: diacylglycerol kinase family protein [Actinospica sp.]|nr:diacylglycerol kinase family protein [Actinospica sp.]
MSEVRGRPARGGEQRTRGGWRQRVLAWLALASMLAVAVVVVVTGVVASLAALVVGIAGLAVVCAAAWTVVAYRGLRRKAAIGALVVAPLAVAGVYLAYGLLLEVALCVALAGVGLVVGNAALSGAQPVASPEPAGLPAGTVRRPYLIMNPRSGGGKVARFRLGEAAVALGAEVALLTGPEQIDVTELAMSAVDDGADLLGVAGGDGTQALVAAVAAARDVPFLVISAGTRNHFAMDLGLDRDDPARCLDALADGVELRIDLGEIGGRAFVNNASFGAYAEVVQSPAYRDDKVGTALQMLPDLIGGHRGPELEVRVDGRTVLTGPQAVLVSNNPYESGDIAGLGRRARLDGGVLGVLAVKVDSGAQAAALVSRRGQERAVARFTGAEVVVDAAAPSIPVGIDGESVLMPTPVLCRIRPGALRVVVPRLRPGVPMPRERVDWPLIAREALGVPLRGRAG